MESSSLTVVLMVMVMVMVMVMMSSRYSAAIVWLCVPGDGIVIVNYGADGDGDDVHHIHCRHSLAVHTWRGGGGSSSLTMVVMVMMSTTYTAAKSGCAYLEGGGRGSSSLTMVVMVMMSTTYTAAIVWLCKLGDGIVIVNCGGDGDDVHHKHCRHSLAVQTWGWNRHR